MDKISDLIWYLVDKVEKQRGTQIHQVILTGSYLDFTMSRYDDLSSFASESGHFTLSNTEESYPKRLSIVYSDNDVRDVIQVYTAEEINGQIAPTAILYLQPYDEMLCNLIGQIEHIAQDNPLLFEQHSQELKDEFIQYMSDMYDRHIPESHTLRFVGFYSVENDDIPLGRLESGEIVTIASNSVPLHLDNDYPAVKINNEYFIHDYSNIKE